MEKCILKSNFGRINIHLFLKLYFIPFAVNKQCVTLTYTHAVETFFRYIFYGFVSKQLMSYVNMVQELCKQMSPLAKSHTHTHTQARMQLIAYGLLHFISIRFAYERTPNWANLLILSWTIVCHTDDTAHSTQYNWNLYVQFCITDWVSRPPASRIVCVVCAVYKYRCCSSAN